MSELTEAELAALGIYDILHARYDSSAVKPEEFVQADWDVLKRSGQTVAARHKVANVMRKLPSAWFD